MLGATGLQPFALDPRVDQAHIAFPPLQRGDPWGRISGRRIHPFEEFDLFLRRLPSEGLVRPGNLPKRRMVSRCNSADFRIAVPSGDSPYSSARATARRTESI